MLGFLVVAAAAVSPACMLCCALHVALSKSHKFGTVLKLKKTKMTSSLLTCRLAGNKTPVDLLLLCGVSRAEIDVL
jgi:hypothetical protein